MADHKRMLLIENGLNCLIQNSEGDKVTFESLEDMTRVTGVDFTNKFYVGYEPEINFFKDSRDPSVSKDDIPNATYEAMINNISTLASRKANPLYGLSGQELADKEEELAKIAEWEARRAAFKSASDNDGIKKVTIEQADNYLDNQYDSTDLDAALTTLNAAGTAQEIKDALIPAFLELRQMSAKSKAVDRRIIIALLEVIADID